MPKSNKFDYSDEKTCVFQIFFVTLCAERNVDCMIYIVCYDLKPPTQRYASLVERVKSYSGWAYVCESTYLIRTDDTAAQVRDALGIDVDGNDKLFVGTISAPAAWKGLPQEVSEWIKNNLD